MTPASDGRPRQPPMVFGLLLLVAWTLIWFRWGWVGYIGSDDWVYILNARDRIVDPFLIGTNHWQVRLTLTLPMAAALGMLGESELAAALPTLLYAGATAALVLAYLWRRAGAGAALMASALLAASPLLVVNATSLRIDAVENFYVVASLLSLLVALEREGDARWMLGSGVLAGLAFATRPTAVALLAFHGLLFVLGHGVPRRRYVPVLVGFLAIWLAETAYYWHATGRLFYRFGVDFHHDQVVRAGTLLDSVLFAPLRMLLGSHSFGLAFWLLPLLVWAVGRRRQGVGADPAAVSRVRLLALFAAVWIVVFSAFASKLVLDPRYLAPALSAALVVAALAASTVWQSGRQVLAGLIVLSILVVQALGLMLENRNFLYAERWLVQLASARQEVVYTDPQTRERAMFLLQLAGLEARTRAEPPPPGALFLAVPGNAARGQYNTVKWRPADYQAGPWAVEATLDPGRTLLGLALQSWGLQGRLPESVWTKLSQPNPPVHLLRRPE